MPGDISYGQIVVITGVNVDNDIISTSQHAIAFATTNELLLNEPITGLSAETFAFNENVDVSNNLGSGGNLDVSGTSLLHDTLTCSKSTGTGLSVTANASIGEHWMLMII